MKKFISHEDICEATISDIHLAMKAKKITCIQLVEAYLKRIDLYDKKGVAINSVIAVNGRAMDIADKLDEYFDKQGFMGPLHGIPILLKDNICTNDMETTAGSLSMKGYIPSENAFIVDKLISAGAIILAKVNLHEFAIWGETVSSILGQTLNPYDLERTPGGSSGGTGAAIAANFGMVGIGTDTVNSVRSPASACSLVGFRPTVGLVSRSGIVPYSMTQDTAGPIARTVEDAIRLLDVMKGFDIDDIKTNQNTGSKSYLTFLKADGLNGKRIGVLKSLWGNNEVHQEVNIVMSKALMSIKEAGAELIDIHENIDTDVLVKDVSVHLFELKRDLNEYLSKNSTEVLPKSLSEIIDSGKYHEGIQGNLKIAQALEVTMPEYEDRLLKRDELRRRITEIMDKHNVDALVYPHQKRLAVRVGETQIERNGVIAATTGFPACTVPAGFSKETKDAAIGIPVGIEFLAREWDEPMLIEIAYGFEAIFKAREKPPNL